MASSPKQTFGGTVRKGDLKYKDQNGDQVIDSKDEVYLGRGGWYGSPFTLGLNFTAKWKNFTLFALGTGGFGGYGMKIALIIGFMVKVSILKWYEVVGRRKLLLLLLILV